MDSLEQKFSDSAEAQLQAEQMAQKTTAQLLKAKRACEEEVKLRLEFERKINTLNNYNRKLVQEKESFLSQHSCLQKNFADV